MLAGGADAAIIPSGIGGFIACKALSKHNSAPEQASRPWDKGRDGFVMGEGAGTFLQALVHIKTAWPAIHGALAALLQAGCDAGELARVLPTRQ